MSKELEYIQRQINIVKQQVKGSKIRIIVTDTVTKHQYDYYERELQTLESIEQALKRLESIDNAKPSEALECLEKIDDRFYLIKYRTTDGGNKEEYEFCPSDTKEYDVIENFLLKAEKEHNSVNLLMQELDCKDMETLRKYARCGYEKLNKQYLKWEDLEFKEKEQTMEVILNGNPYFLCYYRSMFGNLCIIDNPSITIRKENKDFFNDLHLERVEE